MREVEYFSAFAVFKKSVERCIGKRHTTCMRAESAGPSETALRHVPFTYSCSCQLQSDLFPFSLLERGEVAGSRAPMFRVPFGAA